MSEMTVKDAVKILRANVMVACDTSDKIGYETPLNKTIEEALNVVIRAAEQSASDDCVSRQAALDAIIKELCIKDESYLLQSEKVIYNVVKNMPPATPTHGTCKFCSHRDLEDKMCDCGHSITWQLPRPDDWYCKDFERRSDKE